MANRIRESIKDTGPAGTRVLVLEKPGQKLMATLGPNNPFPREFCHRESCPLKNTRCLETCSKEGVVYVIWCQRCHTEQLDRGATEPKDSVYIGETSRTVYTRFHQHVKDYIKASKQTPGSLLDEEHSSFMMDHSRTFHGGHQDFKKDFLIKVISTHRDPLTRQTTEAVRIQMALGSGIHTNTKWKETPITSLNRKGEFFAPVERWEK